MTNAEKEAKRRPLYSWVLIILVFILAISAICGGILLFIAPDGKLLYMSTDALKNSPFSNYLIPGILLFIFLGVFPLFIGLGLVNTSFKGLARLNPWKRHYWAWAGAVTTGAILLVWVIVEIIVVGYVNILEPVTGVWGALILCLTLLPQVRRYYRVAAVPFNPKRLF